MTTRHRTAWTFAITSAALFMASLDNLVVTTALPSIRDHLHASLEGLQWTVNAYTLTFAVPTRAAYKHLWEMVERITGLPFQTVVDFFAVGMLMNVAAAMDLPSVDERWTSWCPKD